MNQIEVQEISEYEAAYTVERAGREEACRPVPLTDGVLATEVLDAIQRTTGCRPVAAALRTLGTDLGVAYVTDDDWPGSGFYRVTVT